VGELLACAPVAVAHAKRVLDAAAKPALATTLALEVTAQALCARTDDFGEATRAFAEKRDPEFSGR
jgi:enoyl-CoA hydratase/carnithine racemase